MTTLYNKIPYFRKVNSGATKNKNVSTAKKDSTKKDQLEIFEHLARFIMTLKQVSVTYNITNGITLPGFRDSTRMLGMNIADPDFAPGLGFVFGSQKDILGKAMEKGWIVKRQNLANPYAQISNKTLNYRANLEPFKGMKIELTGNRTYSENNSAYVIWDGNEYRTNTRTRTGNYSISTITIQSAFKNDDKFTHASPIFEKFRAFRGDFARILSEKNPNSAGYNATTGTYDGYGLTQQDVVIYSFMAAYTGRGASKTKTNLFPAFPLPNWNATYDGLGKLKPLQKIFRSVILRHSYRSTYSIGGFSNNLLFQDDDGDGFTDIRLSGAGSNYIAQYQINTVTISEQFAPLIKVDLQFVEKGIIKGLMANVEYKKDRNIGLNPNIPQVTETKGSEWVFGFGYRYPDLELKRLKIKGKTLKSDVNFKVDLSIRKNVTVLRRVIDGYNQLTGGSNVITLKTSIDYVISQNINLRIFYDRIINRPVISTSFPTSNTNTGVSLRINLGN
jgi:cell surface protein SprA